MATTKIIIRKSVINSKGKSPLKLRLFKNQEVKEVSLKCTVRPENWDQVSQKVKNDKMMC